MTQNISSHFSLPLEDINHIFNSVGDNWKKLSNQRLLLTGGTGFIGKWILSSFLNANRKLNLSAQIVIVSRDPESFLRNFPVLRNYKEIHWVKKDIREITPEDCKECSFCIHGATDIVNPVNEVDVFETCVLGTSRIIDAMNTSRGRKRMLILSSGAVYKNIISNELPFSEDSLELPLSQESIKISKNYIEGKRLSEFQSIVYAKKNPEFEVVIARCFSFVGPYNPLRENFAIGNFIEMAIKNKDIVIRGAGNELRSYLYASDLSYWLWTIFFNAKTCEIYNVGGVQSISISDLAIKVNKLIGGSGRIKILGKSTLNTLNQSYLPLLHKIFKELNVIETVSLEQAIIKTAFWAKNNFHVKYGLKNV